MSRLILIEGLFGSGKSTTTRWLEQQLRSAGRACTAYEEFDLPHPVPVDPDEIEAMICGADPLGEAERAWSSLDPSPGVRILESRVWQYSAMFPMLADIDESRIRTMLGRLYQDLVPFDPVLVFFDHTDPAQAMKRTLAQPGRQEWLQWVSAMAERLPWLRSRGLTGPEGWLCFCEAWAMTMRTLVDDVPFPVCKLVDAHGDWPGSLAAILDASLASSPGSADRS